MLGPRSRGAVVFAALAVATAPGIGGGAPQGVRRARPAAGGAVMPLLWSRGVGQARFGEAERRVTATMAVDLGRVTWRGVNPGCGPRFSEVAWHDLVLEFRSGVFSGYRYAIGGWPLAGRGAPGRTPVAVVEPSLITPLRITLGSTLGELRAAYRPLRFVGVDRWAASDGTIFVFGDSRRPASRTQRLHEIKLDACGDF